MDAVREAWTDDRLDDLANRMDRGFERVDAEFRELRCEMNERFVAADNSANDRFVAADISVNARFDALNARFDSLNRNLIIALVTVVGALIGSNVT